MPTEIDSLVVTLGLDPKNFTDQQRKVLENFRRGNEEARRSARNLEESGKQVVQYFSNLHTKVVGLLGVFVGGRGLKEFASWQTQVSADTGRMSRVLDTSTQTLSAWRGAANVTGGSAEGMTQSIQGLVSQFQMFSLTGESLVIPWFRALNVQIADGKGKMRGFDEIMLDLADRFSTMDPAKAAAFGKALGFDDGTINLLIKGRIAVMGLLEEQKKLGVVTAADAAAAEEATKQWRSMEQAATSLGRVIVTNLSPTLSSALRSLTEFLSLGGKAGEELDRMDARQKRRGLKTYDEMNKDAPKPKGFFDSVLGAVDFTDTDFWRRLRPPSVASLNPHTTSNANSEADIKRLKELGWSHEAAVGLAANIHRESGGRTDIVGDGGKAYGLSQWHPDRQADFAKFAGHDIRQSTRDEQLRFIDHELRNKEINAGNRLKSATSAAEAARIASTYYERPKDTQGEADKRANIAVSLQRAYEPKVATVAKPVAPVPTQQPATQAIALQRSAGEATTRGATSITGDVSHETNIGTVTVITQATDAEGIGKDIAGAVKRQSMTAQANYGPGG